MFVAEELQCKKYIKHWFITQWPNDIKRVAQNSSGAGKDATNPGEKFRFYSKNLLFCQKKKELEICQHKKMPLLFRSLYITLHILVKTRWIVTDTFNSYGHQQNLPTN